ncbi:TPA: bL21 family ribosomal protein, partial [Candidatus Avigastranaerophilus faecigallinarum]|nr:bL21 family ribosomal protein [Candidatus Avigastranaerophilus faecigallinarum]
MSLINAKATTASSERNKEMFAIIETGGKQYQVTEGRYVDIELLEN